MTKNTKKPERDAIGEWQPLALKGMKPFIDDFGKLNPPSWVPIFDLQPKLRLHSGTRTIAGDLVLDEHDPTWGGSVIDGDLLVEGNLIIPKRKPAHAPLLIVMGSLRAKNIYNLRCQVVVKGDVRVDGYLVSYAAGSTMSVGGTIDAKLCLGAISARLGSSAQIWKHWWVETLEEMDDLKPELFAKEPTPIGGVLYRLDLERVLDAIREGASLTRDGGESAEQLLENELRQKFRETAEVDLSDLSLTRIPEFVFALESVKSLALPQDTRCYLDPRIAALGKSLKIFRAPMNAYDMGPIEALTGLELLDVQYGKFTPAVAALERLAVLHVEKLWLPLPDAFFALPKLRELCFGFYPDPKEAAIYADFPERLTRDLRVLEIFERGSKFREVPACLGEFTALERLSLNVRFANGVDRFPSLRALRRLRELAFSGECYEDNRSNRPIVTAILDAIQGLPLEDLALPRWGRDIKHRSPTGKKIERAAMEEFPDRFAGFTRLRRLDLSFNGLKHVPRSLLSLAHVEQIDLSGNELPGDEIELLKERLPRATIILD